jgi:Uncharacterized protein conserved in bacteria (DUF2252)
MVTGLQCRESSDAVTVVDAVYWINGCSSLGRLRYAVMLAGRRRYPSKPWLGGRLCGDLRLRFGRLSDRYTINAFGPGILRYQVQAELLAHHARKEAADRVLLPARRLYDGGDRCPLGCLSRARTASCLVPLRVEPKGMILGFFAGLFAGLLGRASLVFVAVLPCDI